jgi:hypothetical protein
VTAAACVALLAALLAAPLVRVLPSVAAPPSAPPVAAAACAHALGPILDVRGKRGARTYPARRARCEAYVAAGLAAGVPAHVTAALGWAETKWGTDDHETGRSGCCHGPLQVSLRVHGRGRNPRAHHAVRAVAVRTLARLVREEGGDVFRVAARWNAGPGWRRSERAQRWARHVARVAAEIEGATDVATAPKPET